jgi:AraC-like DNA-binding protein
VPYQYTIQAAREYLEEHFEKHVSLEELADIAHASPFYLNRIFRQEVGLPPHEYQIQVRIKQAQSFLQAGKSIAETAHLTGFSDQSHLTRFFKRYVGISPGEYIHFYQE